MAANSHDQLTVHYVLSVHVHDVTVTEVNLSKPLRIMTIGCEKNCWKDKK